MKVLFQLNPYLQQRQKEKPSWIFPIRLAMYVSYLHNQGDLIVWDKPNDGTFDKIVTSESQIDIPFLELPHANRILTEAKNPIWQRNGNFKHFGTYILSASGCWFGGCRFCVEQGKPYEVRPVEDVISEIEECKALGFKEVFDDSATFPEGRWRELFLRHLAVVGMVFSCNLRIGNSDFYQMRKSGFRMVLFGIESANQETLDKIKKGVKVEEIIPTLKKATEAGIDVHTAWMFGYSWESDKDAINTLRLIHYLLKKGYSKTAQASFYNPQNKEKEGSYSNQSNEHHRKYIKKIYDVAIYPEFWFNQIKDIRNVDDLKYLWLKIKKGIQR